MSAPTQTSPESSQSPQTTPTSPETLAARETDPQTPQARSDERDPDAAARSREAAGYRTRLRETEAERDALRERVDAFERREVESIARSLGAAVPADLWTLISLDDLRVDGTLDAEATTERVKQLLAERPTWRQQLPDLGAGPRANGESRELGFSQLLGKGRR